MKSRAVPDPNDVRQAGRVLRPGGLHRLIERVPQEILPGFGLDGDEPICVLGFQHGLQLIGVDALGTLDDRSRVVGYYLGPRFLAEELSRIVYPNQRAAATAVQRDGLT